MKSWWLDRRLMTCAYCYALCLSEKDFHAHLKKLGVAPQHQPAFVLNEQSNATTHFFQQSVTPNADVPVALVCLPYSHEDPIGVAGLLVHEAVHIWQAHSRNIGSFNDHGDEEEAYAIQWIAQQLMWSYKEQTT